jgi:hypothetical protein
VPEAFPIKASDHPTNKNSCGVELPLAIMVHYISALLIYAALASIVQLAGSRQAVVHGDTTAFPILGSYRVLAWSGGAFCALAAAFDVHLEGLQSFGVIFGTISLVTVLLPLRSVAISPKGVEALPILFLKRVVIEWEMVSAIECRSSVGMIVIRGCKKSIVFTRFNADRESFLRLLRQRTRPDVWAS